MKPKPILIAITSGLALTTTALLAPESTRNDQIQAPVLAKSLLKPAAYLISVPIQNKLDFGKGPTTDD